MKNPRLSKLGSLRVSLQRTWEFVSAHPYLAFSMLVSMVALGSGDVIRFFPSFSPLTNTLFFRTYHGVHDLLAIVLALYVAYRWLPAPGASALVLFAVAHIPYFVLVSGDLTEYVEVVVFGAVGVGASFLIRERRRTADLIRQREMEIRAQFNASPIGVAIVQDGRFRYVNPQLQLYTGYSQERLVGMDSMELIVKEDRWQTKKDMVRMLKGKSFSPCHFRTVTRNGDIKWLIGSVTSIHYRGRRATLSSFLDVTERYLAEEAKKELALFTELSPAPLLRFDREGRVVFANSAARAVLGDGLGVEASLASVLPGLRDIDPLHCIREGLLINREAMAGGRCFQLAIQGIPELGTGHVYASDITVRRNAEEQYAMVIRTAMDGFWMIDVEGNLLDVNDAYCCLSGYSRGELLRMKVQDLEALETPEETARHIRRIAEVGGDRFESCHRTKDGGVISIEISVTCAKPGGGRFYVFLHDITRRKRMEEELHSLTRRMVDIQEQERRLIARELHDQVGQYITGLKLTLDMLKNLSGEKAEFKLSEAKTILDELMAQVRSLSLQLHPSMLDDLGLLPALLWHFERYTSQTGVRVSFTHGGLDLLLPVDVNMAAYRIVQEALTNVARYSGVKEASVRVRMEVEKLQLEIEDRGAGFDFNKVVSRGTTCGLTGMRERATALGGRLTVESVPGFGTRVMATLPIGE